MDSFENCYIATAIFSFMQFDYPQFLSCHEADGLLLLKNGNSSNGQTFHVGLELNSVIIFIGDRFAWQLELNVYIAHEEKLNYLLKENILQISCSVTSH